MREIVIKNGEIMYKDENKQEKKERKEIFKSQKGCLQHQVDRKGLQTYLKTCEETRFISLTAKIQGKNAVYNIWLENEKQVPNVEVNQSNLKPRENISLSVKVHLCFEDGDFIALTGKKMKSGDFFFGKVYCDGEIVELPINVERVIEGVNDLYQIIIDRDGTWGYNV